MTCWMTWISIVLLLITNYILESPSYKRLLFVGSEAGYGLRSPLIT